MLTRKQHELLMFIHERMKESGIPPSFDEMKDALDLRSKSGIHRLITALEERGFIRRLAHRARATRAGLFLHEDAAAEIEERLSEVNKSFTSPAIVTGFPDPWREIFPDAKIVADDDVLDLVPQEHDLVIHALSLHWANDPVGQLVQCRHALRPDGLFLGPPLRQFRGILTGVPVPLEGVVDPDTPAA